MKRYIKSSSVIICAALVLASCSKTEDVQGNPDSALQIESVSGISPFALMQEPSTKAVITGNTLTGSDAATGVGIFVTASNGGAYDGHANGYTNVKFANSGSGWSTATPVYLSDTEGKLYGYFPYNSSATDLKAIPVESSLGGTDYLYADSKTVSHSNKSVSLTMNHALSRLHLTIRKGANFTASAPLSKITLTSTAIDATGTMDLATGAVTASKKSGETGTVELTTDGTITADGIEKDILLVPANNSEGKKSISISLMIAGKPAGITIPAENGLDIRSGIQNNVTLTVEDTGIKVTGVGIGVWGDGGGQTVEVSGHAVTVKLDERVDGIEKDVLITAYKEGSSVTIETFSKSEKTITCQLDDDTMVEPDINNNISVFTIPDVSKDIAATIGYLRPESISLSLSSQKTYVGCSFKLKATVLPDDAYNKNHSWSTSNASVAAVDENGRVTLIAKGSAYIKATTEVGGLIASCIVTVEETALSGEFSVGPAYNCKEVRFSRGNLRYTPNIESWWFFDNQYNYGHSADQLSLFTWGYGNWSTSWNTKSYQTGNFTDWGTQIGDGKTWRTLSSEEWEYLFNSRTDASTKVGYATVGGVNGFIILPDSFSDPMKNNGSGAFVPKSTIGWTANVYTTAGNWEAMESAGAVFLPAAGSRSGSNFYLVGDSGYYWSSTVCDSNSAYRVYFNSESVFPIIGVDRLSGYSVRLITESK